MQTKKKTSKSNKKEEKVMKKQIENIERNLNVLEKIDKEEKRKEKQEEERKELVKNKIDEIREDLKGQLFAQNKFGKQFDDLVEDYIFFVKLKEDLQYDIQENGIRYRTMTGNGYPVDKPNESVQNLVKINAQMLKILQDLELKAPEDNPGEGEGDDLL